MKVGPAVHATSSRELYAFKQKCDFLQFGFVVFTTAPTAAERPSRQSPLVYYELMIPLKVNNPSQRPWYPRGINLTGVQCIFVVSFFHKCCLHLILCT